MGKSTNSAGPDLARALVAGSFTGTGQSVAAEIQGAGNLTLSGTFVGTVKLRRSFDGGSIYHDCTYLGGAVSFAAPCSETFVEPERGVLYIAECTAYTSGTINYRLSA